MIDGGEVDRATGWAGVGRDDRATPCWLVPLLCALALLLPLLVTPVLPLIDYYNHIARYFVLSHVDGDPALAANYVKAWALLPNLGLDVLATPLLAVVPPLLAAKLILGAILLIEFTGVLFLASALNRRPGALTSLLLLGLLYSFIVNWGFSNFLLGLGLVFWTLGLWVRLRSRPLLATLVCSVAALGIFFCHGFAFALYGMLLGAMELGRLLERRSLTDPVLVVKTGALLAIQAVLPALLFLQTSTSRVSGGATAGGIEKHLKNGSLSGRLASEFWYRLETIMRVAESPYPVLDILTFCLLVGLVAWALWRGHMRLHIWLVPAVLLFGLLCVVTPPSLFGVGYVSDRIPLVLALVVVAGLSITRPRSREARLILAVVALVGVVRIGAMMTGWTGYTGQFARFQAVTAVVPRGALLADVPIYGTKRRDNYLPRCSMYRPLLLPLRGVMVPLFAFESQQPLRLTGKLAEAQAARVEAIIPHAKGERGYDDDQVAAIARAGLFRYIFMCGRDQLTRPLPANVRVVSESGNMAVLRIN